MHKDKNNEEFSYRIIDQYGIEKSLLSKTQLFTSSELSTVRLDNNNHEQIKIKSLDFVSESKKYPEDINSALYDIASQTHAAEDLTQFYNIIHHIIAKLTYAENFYIALYDESRKTMNFPYIVDTASNIDIDYLANLPVETLRHTLTGYMLKTGQMLHVNTEQINKLCEAGEVNLVGTTASDWLGFPLQEGNKVLGALVVQSYDPAVNYQKDDIELLQFVSQHVATALSRKQADEALKESEKKFREVLENSRVISYKFNLVQNCYEYVSNSIKHVFGFTSEEYLKNGFEAAKKRIHPDDRDNYRSKFKKLLTKSALDKHATIPIIEYRWRHKEGQYRWYSDARSLVYGQNNKAIAIIGSVRDITDFKESEQNLRRTENELLKMQELENIGILAGGLAHDFNNILTGIFGNLSLAKLKLPKTHPSYNYLEKSEISMDRATRLTRQLLTFAKGGEPIREEVELSTLIEETTSFDLTGSNVKPIFNFTNNHLDVNVDKGQIQQLISNLVINADQAMPEGGLLYISIEKTELKHNELAVLKKGSYLKVMVRDEGTGMDETIQKRIFDPYFSTKPSGSGIGLTTVFSIVKKHDGYITVDSKLGEGTTFIVYLPSFDNPNIEEVPTIDEHPNQDINRRILVMDDDEIILMLVSAILEEHDFIVETALNGEDALQKYKESKKHDAFDVIIMDLTIPGGMGGKDAVIEFLKFDANVNCVVSSGYADDPIMANYAEYGFKGVISKPFEINDLLTVLNQVISATD